MSLESTEITTDITQSCRVCRRDLENAGKLRAIFESDRLPKIIYNVTHFEIVNEEGLPKFICDKCLEMLKKFSQFQVNFRRSEELYKMILEKRKTANLDQLHELARSIDLERLKDFELKKAKKKTKKKKNKKVPKTKNTEKDA